MRTSSSPSHTARLSLAERALDVAADPISVAGESFPGCASLLFRRLTDLGCR
jgi:hypothetical protein